MKLAILAGSVLARSGESAFDTRLIRVVKVLPNHNRIIFIEIPSGPRKSRGKRHANYYACGFKATELNAFIQRIEQRELLEAKVQLPKWWFASDDEIRKAYPPKDAVGESLMLTTRDFKLELIRPLLELVERSDFNDLREIGAAAARRAKERRVSLVQVKGALHRYFAFGAFPNTLLPNSPLKGAPGVSRIGKKRKLGRKNAAAQAGNTAMEGKILTEEDRQNLVDGWDMFVRPGTSVPEAFLAMSGAFYNKGYSLKHGLWVPDLLDAYLRPTQREFEYHGPSGSDKLAAARRQMGDGEWARDFRPLSGSARNGVVGFGHVGSLDASPIDVNLNAIFSRSCPIGVGRGMFVRDAWLGMYCGLHVAIGGLSTDDANLAILDAATDKTAILNRYNLGELDPAGIPSVFFSKFLCDNGELRSQKGIESNVQGLGATIEFVESHRGDRNSISETGHHSRHRRLDHHIEGTTRGRQAKRGEPLPIKNALLTKFEYIRLALLWVYWANTLQEVPHLVTAEMRRAGVAPYRIAIYNWAKQEGLVQSRPIDPLLLQAKLLPNFNASIQRNGIVLHRPDTGNAVELLPNANFFGDYLVTSGLIRSAMNGGRKHITVKAHPDDLSKVLLVDHEGVHVLKNTSSDAVWMHEGSIPDLCVLSDTERREAVARASQRDQDLSDQRAFREATQDKARSERKQERLEAKTKGARKTTRSQVRANQAAEARQSLDDSARRGAGQQHEMSIKPPIQPAAPAPVLPSPSGAVASDSSNVLPLNRTEMYQRRLAKFHRERKEQ
jgi:hypothetical protein